MYFGSERDSLETPVPDPIGDSKGEDSEAIIEKLAYGGLVKNRKTGERLAVVCNETVADTVGGVEVTTCVSYGFAI